MSRGLSPLPDEEVRKLYGGTFHVPLQQDSGFYGKVQSLFSCGNSPGLFLPNSLVRL